MSNFAAKFNIIHIKSNFINFKNKHYFYVRFEERTTVGRLQLGRV